MSIQVKYFASLREQLGKDSDQVDAGQARTVAEVWQHCVELDMPANTLMAINMEYVTADHAVNDGDEVAFFPPVTGG